MDRVERALLRIERAVERDDMPGGGARAEGRDELLRAKVTAALGELDEIIREANRG